jgi:hypothetical protein
MRFRFRIEIEIEIDFENGKYFLKCVWDWDLGVGS